ncbi:MAG: VanZ family [Geobacteraceae bacterium]|nr:MAG: VanZ family [Geobacteraceae bacterium]
MSDKTMGTSFPRWLVFLAWGVVITWLSLIPSPPVLRGGLLGWDKFQHAAAYGLLTLLGFHAFTNCSVFRRRLTSAAVGSVIFGALIEVAQGIFTTTRTAEASDLAADIVGAAAACTLVVCVRYLQKS